MTTLRSTAWNLCSTRWRSALPGHEAEWSALLARGIDPEWCQYYNPRSGCLIERDRRPTQCRQFNCGRLTDTDDRIDIVLEVADD